MTVNPPATTCWFSAHFTATSCRDFCASEANADLVFTSAVLLAQRRDRELSSRLGRIGGRDSPPRAAGRSPALEDSQRARGLVRCRRIERWRDRIAAAEHLGAGGAGRRDRLRDARGDDGRPGDASRDLAEAVLLAAHVRGQARCRLPGGTRPPPATSACPADSWSAGRSGPLTSSPGRTRWRSQSRRRWRGCCRACDPGRRLAAGRRGHQRPARPLAVLRGGRDDRADGQEEDRHGEKRERCPASGAVALSLGAPAHDFSLRLRA